MNISVETMKQNGKYSPTSFKFKFDVCKIFGRNLAGQNPFVLAIFTMVRKNAKLPSSCPIKKDLYFVKNIIVEPGLFPVVGTKHFRFNLELTTGKNQMRLYFCQWYLEVV
jgi:hypothetical protein